ncbi:Protein of unknown function [Pyronema omphalodes CBS 100304]|uniref:Uncharacterized protein n=1 Tax=Pyronema omphalodes (strain CBS 100304) TaxID=1076935 RepID=U4LVL9_PYROM|nr:Protein of unknown function [Pyronema omphalodes CBS 100304]
MSCACYEELQPGAQPAGLTSETRDRSQLSGEPDLCWEETGV